MRLFRPSILLLSLLSLLLCSCATREVVNELNGSTAQRLVTHSIDHLMHKIPAEDFDQCEGSTVLVKPWFIKRTPTLSYATERFKLELAERFSCHITQTPEAADYTVNIFFTSLGTEFDILGLTIPFLVIPGYSGASDVNLLAVEMFHGISEMYYYISDASGRVILRREKTKAQVRTDKFALPFLTIPINTMD